MAQQQRQVKGKWDCASQATIRKEEGTDHRRPCPVEAVSRRTGRRGSAGARQPLRDGRLTNREKASLNSETCSSVRESACGGESARARWVLGLRPSPCFGRRGMVLQRAGLRGARGTRTMAAVCVYASAAGRRV